MAGYTLIELVFTLGLAATLSVAAGASAQAALEEYRAAGAVRYLSARLQQARMEAIVRGVHVAVRFDRRGSTFAYAVFVDRNRNGVLANDIQRGIDREIRPFEELADHFAGVAFGTLPALPSVESAGQAVGNDPIRTGPTDMVVFTPLGTATPGSLYVRGGSRTQFAVRIFGETGKTRILRFNTRSWEWTSLARL